MGVTSVVKMANIGTVLPAVVMTIFWLIIGGVVPWLIPKGDNKGIIQTMLVMTSVCCYMFWLSTWLMQMNPLVGPSISETAMRVAQAQWS